jgi:chromosome partitioning protein
LCNRPALPGTICGQPCASEEAEARAYVTEAGYVVLDGCVLERPAYRKAQNGGRAITETSFRNLNTRADALLQALIDRVGDDNG